MASTIAATWHSRFNAGSSLRKASAPSLSAAQIASLITSSSSESPRGNPSAATSSVSILATLRTVWNLCRARSFAIFNMLYFKLTQFAHQFGVHLHIYRARSRPFLRCCLGGERSTSSKAKCRGVIELPRARDGRRRGS